MSTVTPVEKIRLAIADQLTSLGAQDSTNTREAILIRNGLFCGRKFQCEGYEVVWFIEEDEIKYFSPCGNLLKSESAIACLRGYQARTQQSAEQQSDEPSFEEIDTPRRRAA